MVMHAVQLTEVGAPLSDRRVPVGEPTGAEVLIRVAAAGVCRSDVHYRSGASFAGPLPLTLGHEVAGTVERLGSDAGAIAGRWGIGVGSRVAVHYLVTCGMCRFCTSGHEQFCPEGAMIGKHRGGGFAEYLTVAARNLVPVPESVSLETAAVMMCSTATALHALRKADLRAGERVAVFGVGGLGMSAVQLARVMGALEVYAVDIDADRLNLAARYGAVPLQWGDGDAATMVRELSSGGVEVAVELLGLPQTIDAAVRSLAPLGRAAIAGISEFPVPIDTYRDLVGREATVVGVSDHTRAEIEYALTLAARGLIGFDDVITRRVPLDATAVNGCLDSLAGFGPGVRSIVCPTSPQ